jgi:hypothetical protein
MNSERLAVYERAGVEVEPRYRHIQDVSHAPQLWRARIRVEKRWLDAQRPYEVVEADHNLLTTLGATALWTALSTTGGLAVPFSVGNAQIAVGDGTTTPTTADADLSATAGVSVASVVDASNTLPISLTTAAAHGLTSGRVVVISGVGGNLAANGTFEVSVTSGTVLLLIGSSGSGAYTSGGTVQPINKYRQVTNAVGTGVITGNEIAFKATVDYANANHAWNEWAMTTGGASANKQASPPPTLLDHAVPSVSFGTKTSAESWSMFVALGIA